MYNVQNNLIGGMAILPGNFFSYLKTIWSADLIGPFIQALRESLNFLRTLENIQRVDASIPQYALRERGSEAEKNLLACTVSGEVQVLFFNISGSEFIDLYVGRSVTRIRKFWEQLWNKTEKKDCAAANNQLLVGQKRQRWRLPDRKAQCGH